jgi:large subunit ribosomal protein L30
MVKQVKITLVKSPIGSRPNHRANLRGLGLARLNQCVTRDDTPCIRGMITKVCHLVRVEELS